VIFKDGFIMVNRVMIYMVIRSLGLMGSRLREMFMDMVLDGLAFMFSVVTGKAKRTTVMNNMVLRSSRSLGMDYMVMVLDGPDIMLVSMRIRTVKMATLMDHGVLGTSRSIVRSNGSLVRSYESLLRSNGSLVRSNGSLVRSNGSLVRSYVSLVMGRMAKGSVSKVMGMQHRRSTRRMGIRGRDMSTCCRRGGAMSNGAMVKVVMGRVSLANAVVKMVKAMGRMFFGMIRSMAMKAYVTRALSMIMPMFV